MHRWSPLAWFTLVVLVTHPLAADEPTEQPAPATQWRARTDPSNAAEGNRPSAETTSDQRVPLSPELQVLRDRVRHCLALYYFRPASIAEHGPWGVMHSLLGYGVDTQLYAGDRQVNAIAWLCWNSPCYGLRLFYTENGEIRARQGQGFQGHQGQFLAMMAQCRVPKDYPMKVDGRPFTIGDVIQMEMNTCQTNMELTFKLLGLVHYLETDAKWQNQWDGDWDISKLIEEELKQPIVGATCGGTHRLMGLSYAVRKRQNSGKPVTGQWQRAQAYLNDFHQYALRLQNPDGSFSTSWFAGRANFGDIDRRLQTTGHILEWLVYSLPKESLTEPQVVRSVSYLTDLMLQHSNHRWAIGPKGHAIRALALYDERVFGGKPGTRGTELMAERQKSLER